MNLHPSDDRLLDLILDLLAREEEAAILTHVAGCPACERRMREMAAEKERLRSAYALRAPDRLAGATSADRSPRVTLPARPSMATRQARRDPRRKIPYRIVVPVAGGVVLAALLLVLMIPRDRPSMHALTANWLPSGVPLLQRGDSSEEIRAGALAQGVEAYSRRDLDEAVRKLEIATVPGELEPFRRLYLASALTLSGKYTRAVHVLRPVELEYLPEPWATEARWTLLVALQNAGRTASADSLRSLLRENPGEIGDRVRRLP